MRVWMWKTNIFVVRVWKATSTFTIGDADPGRAGVIDAHRVHGVASFSFRLSGDLAPDTSCTAGRIKGLPRLPGRPDGPDLRRILNGVYSASGTKVVRRVPASSCVVKLG